LLLKERQVREKRKRKENVKSEAKDQ